MLQSLEQSNTPNHYKMYNTKTSVNKGSNMKVYFNN